MRDSRARLHDVAAALLDGSPVDWPAEESSAPDDRQRSAMRHLRVLREIAAVHGTLGIESADGGAQPASWGSLRILERVGRGSFGDVYRAWDRSLDREVALKLLHRTEDAAAEHVIEEGRLLARVRHPAVVTIYGAERRAGRVGLWMEFIHGRTLAQQVREQGPVCAEDARAIAIDICAAVEAVHAAGLLHRDIKAHNVMREADGRIVLMDFSAGQERAAAAASASAELAGTPLYMAPEVLAGEPATVSSDIYSLGVLMFFLVTGQYPVAGHTVEDVRDAHARGSRRRAAECRPDLPAALSSIIERALSERPVGRFARVSALRSALEAQAPTAHRSERRVYRLAAAAATVAILATGYAGWRVLQGRDSADASHAAAHETFVRAQYQLAKRTPDGLRAAQQLFDASIEGNPMFAPAHAGLAKAYTLLGAFEIVPFSEAFPRARAAATDALRLDANNSMAYAVLGYLDWSEGRAEQALQRFDRAIQLDPGNATARQWYALCLFANDGPRAIAEIEKARALDPLSKSIASDAAMLYRNAGRFGEAIERLQTIVGLYPDYAEGRRQLAQVYELTRQFEKSEPELRAAMAIDGRRPVLLGDLGYTLAMLGKRSEAETIASELHGARARQEDAYVNESRVLVALGRFADASHAVADCLARQLHGCSPDLHWPGLETGTRDQELTAVLRRAAASGR